MFVTWLCFRLFKYVLTMVVCMCFIFVLICALFVVLGLVLMCVVWSVLLNVCLLRLGVVSGVVM